MVRKLSDSVADKGPTPMQTGLDNIRIRSQNPRTSRVPVRLGDSPSLVVGNGRDFKGVLEQIGVEPAKIGARGQKVSDAKLLGLAIAARETAIVPVSGFRVGAAAVTKDGRIIQGANREVSDRLCIGTCAETHVAFNLRDAELDTILIVSDSDECIAPCGACRQTLNEVASADARVVMANDKGDTKITTVGALLPKVDGELAQTAIEPFRAGITGAERLFAKATNGGRAGVQRSGVAIVDQDGTLHGGATRKGTGVHSLAAQMALDTRFMSDSESPVAYVVYAGEGKDGGFAQPSGRERQELAQLPKDTKVLLWDVIQKKAAASTVGELLPAGYSR